MNFKDVGIIISKKHLKDNKYVVSLFTKNHGIYSGVITESIKQKYSGISECNYVDFHWQARLCQHLGAAKCELKKSYNGKILASKEKLFAFNSISSILKSTFEERLENAQLYEQFHQFILNLAEKFSPAEYIKFELEILKSYGYELQFDSCADTGSQENLIYLSPKSGRAICASSGKPYSDKLLPLPAFLIPNNKNNDLPTTEDLINGINISSYFFGRYIWPNKEMPCARKILINIISHLNE